MTFVAGSALRVSALLAIALAGSLLLRRRSAAAEHWLLAVADVALTLTNTATHATLDTKSDTAGHFALDAPAARYELRGLKPGFKTVVDRLTVDGKTVSRDLRLELGELQETVNVQKSAATTEQPSGSRVTGPARAPAAPTNCAGTQGGAIVAPLKLKDVKPLYPAGSKAAGTVTLETTIGKDGQVQAMRAVSSPAAELTRAAMAAVKGWQFSPTYLNCEPVEGRMRVTVNFSTARN